MQPVGSGAFGKTLDVRDETADEDKTRVTFHATADHLNAFGVLHGGVAMSVLDMAMGGAVMRTITEGQTTASIQIDTRFMLGGKPGALAAEGRVVRRTKRLAFVDGVLTDAAGQELARASGIWAIR